MATGESDELLGDMDPLEMEIKWLHSPMVKIADAMENKTTVYKVPVLSLFFFFFIATLSSAQGSGKCSVPSGWLSQGLLIMLGDVGHKIHFWWAPGCLAGALFANQ